MSGLASLYPSATGGSGGTLSPLGAPAPAQAAPQASPAPAPAAPVQAAQAPARPTASTEVRSPASEPPGQPQGPDDDGDDDEGAIDIEAAPAELGAELEVQAPPVDLRVDERKDFFADTRFTEPAASSPTDYAAIVRAPADTPMEASLVADGMRAAVAMGIGQTAMQGIWAAAIDAARSPIKTTLEGAQAALTAEWGDKTDAKLASAKAWIEQAERTWPHIRIWLATSGLGNDPAFIKQIAARAERRGL